MKKLVLLLTVTLAATLIIWAIISYQTTKTKGDFYFSGRGSTVQAKEYIQSAIGWNKHIGKDGKVESNSSFERREIGNHTYYIAKAWISNYSVNGHDFGKSVAAIVVAHSEITGSDWVTFLAIDRLDTFLASEDRSMVIPADDLALEMAPYEQPHTKAEDALEY